MLTLFTIERSDRLRVATVHASPLVAHRFVFQLNEFEPYQIVGHSEC